VVYAVKSINDDLARLRVKTSPFKSPELYGTSHESYLTVCTVSSFASKPAVHIVTCLLDGY
jgi:hypothetical protein